MNSRTKKRAAFCRLRPRPKRSRRHLLDLLDEDPGPLEDIRPLSFPKRVSSPPLVPHLAASIPDPHLLDEDWRQACELHGVDRGQSQALAESHQRPNASKLAHLSKRCVAWGRRVGRRFGGNDSDRHPSISGGLRSEQPYSFRRQMSASTTASPLDPAAPSRGQLVALGTALRSLREEQRLSGSQLAALAGVPLWRITAIEEGRLDPDFALLTRLAGCMGHQLSTLVFRAEALDMREEDDRV